MKLLLTSDLHQRIEKWGALESVVRKEKPRFVLIAGDLLPKVEKVSAQGDFLTDIRRHFRAMQKSGPVTILAYLGNDDAHIFEPLLDELAAKGLCVNLNGRLSARRSLDG
jgi:Icc-related predicted phosphoesterase